MINLLKLKLIYCLWMLVSVRGEDGQHKFPNDFLFGVASSAYQVEGGWNEDGKNNSIWDHLFHQDAGDKGSCWIADCSNGDISSDSYHQYKRDVQMLRELGVGVYRFSISWSRIMPDGRLSSLNAAGVNYYNNLIDELVKYNIKPVVTLHHYDLPQGLQKFGGWLNPLIADWFEDYARTIYGLFGNRVKFWVTINEPMMVCQMGYGDGTLAPALKSYGIGNYICLKNMLLAHARAFHVYDKEFRKIQSGLIGISVALMWYEPHTKSVEDQEASYDIRAFEISPVHAIFSKSGDFPARMKEKIAARSKEQGCNQSRLPELSQEQIDYIRGSADFFGFNAYATYSVYRNGSLPGYTSRQSFDYNILLGKNAIPSYADDVNVSIAVKPEFKPSLWMTDYPNGFYRILMNLKNNYEIPLIFVTENGICTGPGLDDDTRVAFLKGHLATLRRAMDDGVNVIGYIFWSLMDSFEWNSGFTIKFGLYEVDFDHPNRTRVPRNSAKVYADIIKNREVQSNLGSD